MAGKKADPILMAVVGLLAVFGIIVLASASTSVSQLKFGTSYYYLSHQIFFALIPGVLVAACLSRVRLKLLKKYAPAFLLAVIVLMMVVFIPRAGIRVGDAARWINLGPVSFQPSEALKLAFILYLACWMEAKTSRKTPASGTRDLKENFLAFLAILGLVCVLLILQSDLGTLCVIVATGVLMYFFANTPVWHTMIVGVIGLAFLAFAVNIAPYRMERIAVFLNPDRDPMGIGYQIKQALIAIGSGGMFGLGLGMSQQKLGLLPHPISDSIFAVLAEETGFVGSLVMVALFMLFLWRGFSIARKAKNTFSSLAAFGITSWIMIQALVNIGAMVGVMPLTGIPLPFVSHGGTALITELAAVGIILNISRAKNEE